MADPRRRLAMMRQLLAVQGARRSGVGAILAEARQVEAAARDAERTAVAGRDEALQDWMQCVGAPGFSPEHGQWLSGRLIERDEEAGRAAARLDTAAQLASMREEESRVLEARIRAGSESQVRLGRRLVRRNEERGLAAQADRVTRGWRPA